MKIALMPIIVTIAAAATLRSGRLLKEVKEMTADVLTYGQPAEMHSAWIRWPKLAADGRPGGRGKTAPYLIDPAENGANCEFFDGNASDSDKRWVERAFHLMKQDDGKLPDVNKLCRRILSQECVWEDHPETLRDFQCAFGAGMRSVQEQKISRGELRQFFNGYDEDENGKLSLPEIMASFYDGQRVAMASAQEDPKWAGLFDTFFSLLNKKLKGKELSFGQWAKYFFNVKV